MNEPITTPRLDAIAMPWDELLWALQQFVDVREQSGPDAVAQAVLRLQYNCSKIDIASGELFAGECRLTVTIGRELIPHAEDIAKAVLDGMECGRVQVDVEGFMICDPPDVSA